MSKSNIIEGVSQLIEQIQQGIDNGSLTLSTNEWIKLDKSLNEARSSLKANRQLEDIAWLMISAFEENKTIRKAFGDELKPLVRGTKLTGRIRKQKTKKKNLIKNKMIDFTKRVAKKAQENR